MRQRSPNAPRIPPWAHEAPLELRADGLIGEEKGSSPSGLVIHGPVILRIREGVIEYIGADDGSVGSSRTYRRIDLPGCVIAPGFVDAHVHATSTGALIDGLDLRGCTSATELLSLVRDACRGASMDVLIGHGWDETEWPDGVPTVHELDDAAHGARVYLSRVDVHSALASSALRSCVARLSTQDGFDPDGPLTRQAHGAARRAAFGSQGSAQRRKAQQAFRAASAALGIVAAHEMAGPAISGSADLVDLLELSQEEPGPVIRGYWGQLAEEGGIDTAAEMGAIGVGGDLFIDGALGSRTACLREPYVTHDHTDGSGDRGALYLHADAIAEHVIAATKARMPAGFHVIGDAATDALCEGMGRAERQCGIEALRTVGHRIEHIEMLDEQQQRLFTHWNLTASVQPMFDALWGGDAGMYAERLGRQRAATLNPFASMMTAGIRLAFGSDSPVTHLGPWQAVAAAIGHHQPNERLTAHAAFLAHTRHGWAAAGESGGVLAVGQPAHLAVWQSAGHSITEMSSAPPRCVLTLVHGAITHQGTW